jgi:hypothetical protein
MGRTACTEPQCLYSRAIPLLPLWAVRPVQSLSACTRVHFTFFLCYLISTSNPAANHQVTRSLAIRRKTSDCWQTSHFGLVFRMSLAYQSHWVLCESANFNWMANLEVNKSSFWVYIMYTCTYEFVYVYIPRLYNFKLPVVGQWTRSPLPSIATADVCMRKGT